MKQLEILDAFDEAGKLEVLSMLQIRLKSFIVLWVTHDFRSDNRPLHLLQKVKEEHGLFSSFTSSEVNMTQVETELRLIYHRTKHNSDMPL